MLSIPLTRASASGAGDESLDTDAKPDASEDQRLDTDMVRSPHETRRQRMRIGSIALLGTFTLLVAHRSRGLDRDVRSPSDIVLASASDNQRPIFLMHGLTGHASDFDNVVSWLSDALPSRKLFPLKTYEGDDSFTPLFQQVDGLIGEVRSIIDSQPDLFKDGYDFVGHSQGALLMRAMCQVMDDHKVQTMVSLAGPQMGVFGKSWFHTYDPFKALSNIPFGGSFLSPLMDIAETATYKEYYRTAYTQDEQQKTSIAELWHDPHHENKFLETDAFFPFVNGLTAPVPEGMRANFIRLRKAVFLTGSFGMSGADSPQGLEPWCSGVFGYFATGSDEGSSCIPMKHQSVFVNDTFGLKTLSDGDNLHVESIAGVGHSDWLHAQPVFEKYVLPHLK